MQSKKAAWAILPIVAGPVGVALARMHVIGPNPGTFFALGVLASLAIGGIEYGFIEGSRAARECEQIRN
jgi:branched-subunit amino acid ABC-type transport system permease component